MVIWGISIGMWFPFMYICSLLWQWWGLLPDMAGVAQRLFSVPAFWLSAVVGAPMFSILLDFSVMVFEDQFRPSDTRIYQVRQIQHPFNQQIHFNHYAHTFIHSHGPCHSVFCALPAPFGASYITLEMDLSEKPFLVLWQLYIWLYVFCGVCGK